MNNNIRELINKITEPKYFIKNWKCLNYKLGTQKSVLLSLLFEYDRVFNTDNNGFYISYEQMILDSGIKDRHTISSYLKDFKKLGIITSKRNMNKASTYQFEYNKLNALINEAELEYDKLKNKEICDSVKNHTISSAENNTIDSVKNNALPDILSDTVSDTCISSNKLLDSNQLKNKELAGYKVTSIDTKRVDNNIQVDNVNHDSKALHECNTLPHPYIPSPKLDASNLAIKLDTEKTMVDDDLNMSNSIVEPRSDDFSSKDDKSIDKPKKTRCKANMKQIDYYDIDTNTYKHLSIDVAKIDLADLNKYASDKNVYRELVGAWLDCKDNIVKTSDDIDCIYKAFDDDLSYIHFNKCLLAIINRKCGTDYKNIFNAFGKSKDKIKELENLYNSSVWYDLLIELFKKYDDDFLNKMNVYQRVKTLLKEYESMLRIEV